MDCHAVSRRMTSSLVMSSLYQLETAFPQIVGFCQYTAIRSKSTSPFSLGRAKALARESRLLKMLRQ